MAIYQTITISVEACVAKLALANPPQNVITISMMEELTSALAEIEARREVAAIVLCGSGVNFSSGVDVVAHTPERALAIRRAWPSTGRRHGVIASRTVA